MSMVVSGNLTYTSDAQGNVTKLNTGTGRVTVIPKGDPRMQYIPTIIGGTFKDPNAISVTPSNTGNDPGNTNPRAETRPPVGEVTTPPVNKPEVNNNITTRTEPEIGGVVVDSGMPKVPSVDVSKYPSVVFAGILLILMAFIIRK